MSSQARNCRSLFMQIRTSLSRVRLQVTAIAAALRPGLTLMKASSISAGAKAGGRDNGAAGPRADYSPTYFAAFLIDPDGNNIEAVCV